MRKILIFVVLTMFLLSYVGINITKHTCVSCHKTEYFFITYKNCCDNHYKMHSSYSASCCSVNHDTAKHNATENIDNCKDSNCCHSKKLFLKVTDNFVNNSDNSIIQTSINYLYLTFCLTFSSNNYFFEETELKTYRPPPLLNFGKQIVILFRQFILYAHS